MLLEAFTYQVIFYIDFTNKQANPNLFAEQKGEKFRPRETRKDVLELLKLEDIKDIENSTQMRLGEKLYSLESDGDSISTFHRLCDPHTYTLTVIKTAEAVFGGFSDISWGENRGYVGNHNATLFYKKPGERVKLFPTKMYELESGVYCHRNWGPNFGGCTPFGLKKMSELSLNAWPKWDIVLTDRQVQSLDVFSMK